jgi:hypothetical protein
LSMAMDRLMDSSSDSRSMRGTYVRHGIDVKRIAGKLLPH